MFTLNRALPLAQGNDLPVAVTDNLHFDVSRVFKIFLHVHASVAERCPGFLLGLIVRGDEVFLLPDQTHTPAAATGRRLDDDRIADFIGDFQGLFRRIEQTVTAGDSRNFGTLHGFFGKSLITHVDDHVRARTDKFDIAGFTDFGEVGVFGQKAVARMDGISRRHFCCADDVRNDQITLVARSRPDAHRLIGETNMQ